VGLAGLLLLAGAAWIYLLYMAWGMANMDAPAAQFLMPAMRNWGPGDLLLIFLMWSIMMAAMMLPSATPMVTLFARNAAAQPHHSAALLTVSFVSGYLAIWTAFSAIVTLAQWGLLSLRLITPMMESANDWLSAGLLISAGIFQFTPIKNACLNKCRTPMGFLMTEWRPGAYGALVMGLRHGTYCTGCCVMLMLLLFVLGVMNIVWIGILTLVVLLEKLLPEKWGSWSSRAMGLVFIGWGLQLLLHA
jgi:predicted metal-binding membrane protein